MKIAAISDDGATISQHFGRAPYYVVSTVEEGKIVARETRPKAGHHTFAASEAPLAPGERHGYDADAQDRHRSMAFPLADCQVLLAGGMGWGAYEGMRSSGIETIVTDVADIEQAALLYLQGRLPNLMEKLH